MLTRMILLTSTQAAAMRGLSAFGAALEPRRVEGGEYAGWYALPLDVLLDPEHAGRHPTLLVMHQDNVDAAIAFPPVTIPE